TLSEDSSDRMIEQVRAGVVDLALVGCAAAPPADLGSISIVSEGLIALFPTDHALSRMKKVSLADVVAHPLVCLPPGTGIRAVLDRACEARGLRPTVALQASAPDAVADLARRGLGVAILSQSMAAQHDPGLTSAEVADVDIPSVLALIWPRTSGRAMQELVRHCEASFGRPATGGTAWSAATTARSAVAWIGSPPVAGI
ncbi:MAG: LysR substrate-binding domain-containing protein, partial [Actinomycetota bacterium]|nr:LysR substrate-binding domain-containing protein [Actinomycetota bacterium]